MLFLLISYLPSFADNPIQIEIDGNLIALEVSPQIENGRTLVPFKAIFEALGLNIAWNDNLRIATAYNDEISVSIKLDEMYGEVNGELIELETKGRIVNGRTLVPLKFISEAFGNEVKWDPFNRVISIRSGLNNYVYTNNLPTVDSIEKLKLIFEYAGKYSQYLYPSYNDTVIESESSDIAIPDLAQVEIPDYSETNVQVAGVDEGDRVKTDGKFIYQLRGQDIKITDISSDTLKVVSTISFDTYLEQSELYLYGNNLVVIGQKYFYEPIIYPNQPDYIEGPIPDMMPIMPTAQKVIVSFYDISYPTEPTLMRTFEVEGSYTTSRLNNGKLYLIINQRLDLFNLTSENLLPEFTDKITINGKDTINTTTIGLSELRYFPDTIETNLLITIGFNLDKMTESPYIAAYLGNSSNVYASSKSMIIAMNRYRYQNQLLYNQFSPVMLNTTELYKFNLNDGTILFDNKSSVPGSVLNQFSMDEFNGYYRIATTSGDSWSDTLQNNLYIFDQNLNLTGKLEGLAQGETIHSARFIGERAYLVTFKQIDPFYVIDLADVTSPKVLGYLKVPGYSDYLHPFDENTIIGFGKETIESEFGQTIGGIKIAMYDVTDVTNPIEKSKIVLGTSNSWTEVLNNHKALLFSKEKQLFALPLILYSGDDYSNHFDFQGAYVYSINLKDGFTFLGKSTHLSLQQIDESYLWYDSSHVINRILWSGTKLYTLSDSGIKSHDIESMIEIDYMTY